MASARRMTGTTSYRSEAGRSKGRANAGRRSAAGNITGISEYIDGNTVRKVYEDPWREEEEKRQARIRERERKEEKRQQRRALGTQLASVLFLCAMLGMVLVGCVKYLEIQSAVTASVKHINSMESQLEDLKAANDSEQARIDASDDLDEIRDVAENELGMVYASADQVVQYDKTDTDYVRQYSDVPDSDQ